MRYFKGFIFTILLCLSVSAFASGALSIKMYQVSRSGKGRYIGVIIAKDTRHGLLFVPRLHGLTPGYHGFHLHQNPSCKNYGKAAGPHWDPTDTKRHRGPYRHGHKGDLPFLYVNKAGFAKHAVIAPHLKLSDLKGHALIIHQGGDNYTDHPENGGGGARVACGVIDF